MLGPLIAANRSPVPELPEVETYFRVQAEKRLGSYVGAVLQPGAHEWVSWPGTCYGVLD